MQLATIATIVFSQMENNQSYIQSGYVHIIVPGIKLNFNYHRKFMKSVSHTMFVCRLKHNHLPREVWGEITLPIHKLKRQRR